ncbi:hypothetical protein ES705_17555 [subsurface metagenome]
MGEHYLLKISPITPFHLGEMMDMERTDEIIHSDTIFSALCYISDKYLGDDNYKTFITPFLDGTPPFLISSAFPYFEVSSNFKRISSENTILFFPKPLIFKNFVEKFPKNIKQFKKIRFISKELFDAYLSKNDGFLEDQFQDSQGNVKSNNLIQGNQVWLSEGERNLIPEVENLWKIQQAPRITIDRITKQTTIYHYSRVHFHKKAGLFILMNIRNDINSERIVKDIITKLRYLGDTGIGGERSLGNGQFELKLNETNMPFTVDLKESGEASQNIITLSLYLPKKSEIERSLLDENSYYQLINRKGWISDFTYHRKSINMIAEGSVLQQDGQILLGKIEDVTPEILNKKNPNYKIHRYGYCYPINLKI